MGEYRKGCFLGRAHDKHVQKDVVRIRGVIRGYGWLPLADSVPVLSVCGGEWGVSHPWKDGREIEGALPFSNAR